MTNLWCLVGVLKSMLGDISDIYTPHSSCSFSFRTNSGLIEQESRFRSIERVVGRTKRMSIDPRHKHSRWKEQDVTTAPRSLQKFHPRPSSPLILLNSSAATVTSLNQVLVLLIRLQSPIHSPCKGGHNRHDVCTQCITPSLPIADLRSSCGSRPQCSPSCILRLHCVWLRYLRPRGSQ